MELLIFFLKGLPRLPWLCRLDLSHNSLGDASLNNLPELCPNLRYISLCDNDIRSMRALIPLSKLKKLETIELMDNEITKNENFRTKVFEVLKELFFNYKLLGLAVFIYFHIYKFKSISNSF